MADSAAWVLPNGVVVHTATSDRSDGDFAVGRVPGDLDNPGVPEASSDPAHPSDLETRRSRLASVPWTWMRQVHGATVVEVREPGDCAGAEADAAVTAHAGAALSVTVADCAPILAWSEVSAPPAGPGSSGAADGAVVAAIHAGWKGLEAGVVRQAVAAMRSLGAGHVHWLLGPCISASEYEFSDADLDRLARRFGPDVRSHTSDGAPALDMRAAVSAAWHEAGVTSAPRGPAPECTASSGHHYSHRARAEAERQVGVIWWEPPSAAASHGSDDVRVGRVSP